MVCIFTIKKRCTIIVWQCREVRNRKRHFTVRSFYLNNKTVVYIISARVVFKGVLFPLHNSCIVRDAGIGYALVRIGNRAYFRSDSFASQGCTRQRCVVSLRNSRGNRSRSNCKVSGLQTRDLSPVQTEWSGWLRGIPFTKRSCLERSTRRVTTLARATMRMTYWIRLFSSCPWSSLCMGYVFRFAYCYI